MFDVDDFVEISRKIYGDGFIPLHRPVFEGNEREYLVECIDSNFVSSVGQKVIDFEVAVAEFTGVKHAVAMVNGTAALHVAIQLAGVSPGDEVISQALTFVATCNAISYSGATPVFVDVDKDTMGMSPQALTDFLVTHAEKRDGKAFNKLTGKRISACVPMHTFGLPCRIKDISAVCRAWGISLVEDAAESLGSYVDGCHTGTFGDMATLSFNGNKVITTGGGGMLLTDDTDLADRAKYLSTTAKVPHAFEFFHDQIGYNYRMPNLNAALGCAQMERLPEFLMVKSNIAAIWQEFFIERSVTFATAESGNKANHWLNAIVLNSKSERDEFLEYSNDQGVMTRPIWHLMSRLPAFSNCQHDGLTNSIWLEDRVVNIPSSVPDGALSNFIKADII
jgi:aminotransferase in exopolysaccharide biosynthesis